MRKTAGKRDVRFCTTGVFMLNDGTKERSLVVSSSGDGTPQNPAWQSVDGLVRYKSFAYLLRGVYIYVYMYVVYSIYICIYMCVVCVCVCVRACTVRAPKKIQWPALTFAQPGGSDTRGDAWEGRDTRVHSPHTPLAGAGPLGTSWMAPNVQKSLETLTDALTS
jgi:hypothetical protein